MANKSHSLCRHIGFTDGRDKVAALVAERNTPSKLLGGMETGYRQAGQAGRQVGRRASRWDGGQASRTHSCGKIGNTLQGMCEHVGKKPLHEHGPALACHQALARNPLQHATL